MERKSHRTVLNIAQHQATINFDEAELSPPFTFPKYQKELLIPRFAADIIGFAIVAGIYILFVLLTWKSTGVS